MTAFWSFSTQGHGCTKSEPLRKFFGLTLSKSTRAQSGSLTSFIYKQNKIYFVEIYYYPNLNCRNRQLWVVVDFPNWKDRPDFLIFIVLTKLKYSKIKIINLQYLELVLDSRDDNQNLQVLTEWVKPEIRSLLNNLYLPKACLLSVRSFQSSNDIFCTYNMFECD